MIIPISVILTFSFELIRKRNKDETEIILKKYLQPKILSIRRVNAAQHFDSSRMFDRRTHRANIVQIKQSNRTPIPAKICENETFQTN